VVELAQTGVVVGLLVAAGVPWSRLIGLAASRARVSRIAGEMAGGLGFGALLLSTHGLLEGGLFAHASGWEVAIDHSRAVLSVLGTAAIAAYLGLVGLGVGSAPGRAPWRLASVVAGAYCVTMLAIGGPLAIAAGSLHPANVSTVAFATFAVAALTSNGLPVVARLLSDHGRLHTSVGLLALSSGVLISIVTFTGVRAADLMHRGHVGAGTTVVGVAVAVAGVLLARTSLGERAHAGSRFGTGGGVLLAACAGLGSHLLLGSWIPGTFAVGLLWARGRHVPATRAHALVQSAGRWLLPLYFVSAGGALGALRVGSRDLPAVLIASAAVTVIAWPATQLAGRIARLRSGERRDLAHLSVFRGVVVIVVALQASHAGLIGGAGVLGLAIAGVASTCAAGLLAGLGAGASAPGPSSGGLVLRLSSDVRTSDKGEARHSRWRHRGTVSWGKAGPGP
jgi:Kef-type K+ transport system membrane component KefB